MFFFLYKKINESLPESESIFQFDSPMQWLPNLFGPNNIILFLPFLKNKNKNNHPENKKLEHDHHFQPQVHLNICAKAMNVEDLSWMQ